MKVFKVHLQDEVPRLGSGSRIVLVDDTGWKWVYMCNISANVARLTAAEFKQVKKLELILTDKQIDHFRKSMQFHLKHKPSSKRINKFLEALT